jgi:TPR repeat protein
MYEEGEYVERDVVKSIEYYTLAADLGDARLKYKLGCLYLDGVHVEQDYIKAYKFIRDAAKCNYYEATCLFDTPITCSESIPDYSNVLTMFQRAVEYKLDDLEYNIGYAYENGLGNYNGDQAVNINFALALEWYLKAEQKNDARAIYRLGKFYENGKGTTQDLWTAQRYYIAGTNFRNPDSMYSLAYLYLEGSDSIRDMPKAFYLFFNAANMGHQESRLLLAPLFGFSENDYSRCIYLSVLEMLEEVAESGNLVVQDKLGDYFLSLGDKENAVKWYKMAVRGKITETYYKLAKIYGEEGFYHNSSKAINLYELAMVNQHTESIFEMAKIYHYGIGISPDLLKAYQLYTDASDRGHKRAYAILNITSDSNDATGGDAVEELRSSSSEDFEYLLAMYEFVATDGRTELQYKVGYIYEKIIETPKYEKAIKWYLMAVDGGHKESAYRLGLLYKKGLGTPQNWSDAIRMFESAMNNGSSSACFELGLINHHGNGVTVDTQKALEYYRKAANNNDLNGQYMMGRLYEDGEFVQSDFLEAIRWYKKAYVQVNDDAVARLYDLQNDKLDEMPFYRREFHILQYFASHHEGKRDEEDPDSYGHMYFRLGCIYLDGTLVKADYERAWGYFHIALEGYNNKDALRYITITNRHLHGSEMLTQNKKLEMFDAVMNILDKDLLYEIAVGYYDQICPADCDTLHITDTKYGTVFKYFIKAFEKGCSKAGKYLGDMWYYGEGVESNNENALKFHRDWAGHQNAQENYQTGYKYYEPIHCEISADKTRRKSNSIAFVYFEIAASHDIGRAQLYLTDMYYYGNGVEKDQKKAIEMYRSYAIDTPHWENFLTGIRYYTGNDTVRKNYDIALVYFDHSRLQGNNDVLKYLGEMYCYGIGTEIDKEKALDYYGMLSARQNHTENTITGLEYLSDTYPFQRNDSIAIIFLEAASTGGNYLIKRRLGDMYYYGKGAQKNREKALDLHEVYSDHCDCVKNLSICLQYYHGDDDTKKSYSIAFKYARTAVSQGSTKALLYLGDMYYFGQGIKQNRSSAMTMYRHFYSIQGSRENIKTGLQYYRGGDGVIKNREVASVFFKRVALQESTADLRQLGDLINNDKDNDTRDVKQAREYYKNAAYQQSIITNYRIGTQYYIGNDGTDEDILVAHIFFDMATRQQKIKYQNELADTLYFSKGDYMDRTKAIELYKECANLQSHRVNLSVGLKYYGHNDDMEENNAVAFIYFNEAAHQGNIEANRYLGDMYYYGQGIKENKTKAMELYDWVASQQGIIENMNTSLQYCSDRGKMKKNYTIALQFLSKLPYKNKYNSHRYLAEELYYGKHIVKNQEKAIQQFKASADIFPNEINTSVGNRYYFGKDGYGKDYSIAFIYLSRAAEQGNGDAQLRLGDMYYFGVGTNKDQAKATRLFKASSNQFDALKNTSIGLEYYQDFERKGKSLFIALIYLLKAAEQGNTTAKEYVSNL